MISLSKIDSILLGLAHAADLHFMMVKTELKKILHTNILEHNAKGVTYGKEY